MIGVKALDLLTAAHAARVEVERKAAQDARAVELAAEGQAVERELHAEWDAAVGVLARLRQRVASFDLRVANAEFNGEIAPGAVPHAEAFRGAPRLVEVMPAIMNLAGAPLSINLPESDRARAKREADEERARQKAEREAERARKVESDREQARLERQAEREAEAERERDRQRYPFYGMTRDVSDAAR